MRRKSPLNSRHSSITHKSHSANWNWSFFFSFCIIHRLNYSIICIYNTFGWLWVALKFPLSLTPSSSGVCARGLFAHANSVSFQPNDWFAITARGISLFASFIAHLSTALRREKRLKKPDCVARSVQYNVQTHFNHCANDKTISIAHSISLHRRARAVHRIENQFENYIKKEKREKFLRDMHVRGVRHLGNSSFLYYVFVHFSY